MNGVVSAVQSLNSEDLPDSGEHFDIIVVGSGPAGSAAASYAALAEHRVLLLERAFFPRDKACGDALGGKTLMHIEELGIDLGEESSESFRFDAIRVTSPNGDEACIPLPEESKEHLPNGWVLRRERFDQLMFERASTLVLQAGGAVIQGFSVKEVMHDDGSEGPDSGFDAGDDRRVIGVRGTLRAQDGPDQQLRFTAPLTIGAGGFNCPVSRSLIGDTYGEPLENRKYYAAAYRQYWRGIEAHGSEIEVHFIEGVLPGYFWIFPVSDEVANVGIGMTMSELDREQVKLRPLLKRVIEEHPTLSARFAEAELLDGSGRGSKLPLGSPRSSPSKFLPRRSAMAGAMLVGDAASLVDSFTGEGIGNALVSAKLAISHFSREGHANGFPLEAAHEYQKGLWAELGPELSLTAMLKGYLGRPWLMNLFVKKISRKPTLQRLVLDLVAGRSAQQSPPSRFQILTSLLF
jgi:geranylgeranyl reductase family protein